MSHSAAEHVATPAPAPAARHLTTKAAAAGPSRVVWVTLVGALLMALGVLLLLPGVSA